MAPVPNGTTRIAFLQLFDFFRNVWRERFRKVSKGSPELLRGGLRVFGEALGFISAGALAVPSKCLDSLGVLAMLGLESRRLYAYSCEAMLRSQE